MTTVQSKFIHLLQVMEPQITIHIQSTHFFSNNKNPVKLHIFFYFSRSHCACDDLFFKCLKTLAVDTNPNEDAKEFAKSMGKIFFNVLKLECAEPKYPMVCLHYTQKFPGSTDPDMKAKDGHQPRKRLWFDFGGNNEPETTEKPWDDQCVEWVEDRSATPTLVFRKPKNLF